MKTLTQTFKNEVADHCRRVRELRAKIDLCGDREDFQGLADCIQDAEKLKNYNDVLLKIAEEGGDTITERELRMIEHRIMRMELQEILDVAEEYTNG